jgi:hypothetical protein
MAFADGDSVRVVGEAFRREAGRVGRLKYIVRERGTPAWPAVERVA